MKIVIAGAGSVGSHLAKLFSNENFDVILFDADESKVAKWNNTLDILTYVGSPTSIKAMKHVGVDQADLFIAVTPDESTNIVCCMVARQLGAKGAIARIDNYEYLKPENNKMFLNDKIGINELIYPEMLAAKEIADSAQYSWVRQWWEFNNGDLVLLSVKMHNDAKIIGKTLREISSVNRKFQVVAIQREGDTISPHGDEMIKNNDLVFFMVLEKDIDDIKILAGKDNDTYPPVKNIMVLGGGKLSIRVSWALPNNVNLTIIEPDAEKCERLSELVKDGTIVVRGDSHDVSLLEDEGYNNVDAIVALTENDDENILACVAARRRGVRKTIAQVEDFEYMDMAEELDVGTIINKKTIAASKIYQHLMKSNVNSVKMLNVADAEVAEITVEKNSKVASKLIKDLNLPRGVNFGGMIRNGHSMLINGMTQLEEGDKVVAFCLENTLKKIVKLFR